MGTITTFYSYKGGTGRSMLLANVAWILAANGYRVLMVDWDLEAPGLHRYFAPFLADPSLESTPGLIDLMWEVSERALDHEALDLTPGQEWFRNLADVSPYVRGLRADMPARSRLDLLGAGRQGPAYASRVNGFDWTRFYRALGGGLFLRLLATKMREEYDFVLIDSRTGVSDTAGICTVEMPDRVVACFTLNNQSVFGASDAVRSILEQRRPPVQLVGGMPDKTGQPSASEESGRREGRAEGFKVLPVPTRVEDGEKTKRDAVRRLAYAEFEGALDWLPESERETYWGAVEVKYKIFFAYQEVLAPFVDARKDPASVLASCERLTAYLTDGLVSKSHELSQEFQDIVREQFEHAHEARITRASQWVPGSFQVHHQEQFLRDRLRVLVQAWEEAGRPDKDLERVLLARLPSAPASDAFHESIGGFLTAVRGDARRRAVTRKWLVAAVGTAVALSIGVASAGAIAYRNAQLVFATAATVAEAERKSRVRAEQEALVAHDEESAFEEQLKQSQLQVLKAKQDADDLAAQAAKADTKGKRQLEQQALEARTAYETARKRLDTTQSSLDEARQDASNAQRQLTALKASQADTVAQRDNLNLLLARANDTQDALQAQLKSQQQRVDDLQSKLNETSAKLQTTLDAYNKVANSVPLSVSPL